MSVDGQFSFYIRQRVRVYRDMRCGVVTQRLMPSGPDHAGKQPLYRVQMDGGPEEGFLEHQLEREP